MKIARLALELMLQFTAGKKKAFDFPVGGCLKIFSSNYNTLNFT